MNLASGPALVSQGVWRDLEPHWLRPARSLRAGRTSSSHYPPPSSLAPLQPELGCVCGMGDTMRPGECLRSFLVGTAKGQKAQNSLRSISWGHTNLVPESLKAPTSAPRGADGPLIQPTMACGQGWGASRGVPLADACEHGDEESHLGPQL